MQIRRVLVPLVGGENDRLGFAPARDSNGRADALFVHPDPGDATPNLGFGDDQLETIRMDYWRRAEQRGQLAARSHRRCNAACKKHGVGTVRRPSKQRGVSAGWLKTVSVEERYEDAADSQEPIEDLAWHGPGRRGKIMEAGDKDVGQVLLDEAEEIGADPRIMGGYVHARFQEVVFRGTTLHALRNTGLPLPMKHRPTVRDHEGRLSRTGAFSRSVLFADGGRGPDCDQPR